VLETGKTEANKIVSRDLNANDFASGSYTIKLKTDDQVKTQQVFIQR
jgi:hypothetical protein